MDLSVLNDRQREAVECLEGRCLCLPVQDRAKPRF